MNTYVTAGQAEGLAPYLNLPNLTAERVNRWKARHEIIVRARIGKHDMFSIEDLRELNSRANADPRSAKYQTA